MYEIGRPFSSSIPNGALAPVDVALEVLSCKRVSSVSLGFRAVADSFVDDGLSFDSDLVALLCSVGTLTSEERSPKGFRFDGLALIERRSK